MKSFREILSESTRVFEFKVKVANTDLISELMDRVETALQAYDLEDISKPKSLPVQEMPMLFPQLGAVEVEEFAVTLNYPCNSEQVKNLIYKALCCAPQLVVVMNKGMSDDEFLTQAAISDKVKKALLDTDPEDSTVDSEKFHGEKGISDFLKSLSSLENTFASTEKTPKAKTTNDEPQGTTSPISGKKGK